MILRQLFDRETWTYTYLLADENTREAVLIDPVAEQLERDLSLIEELSLKLVYTLDTHVHADHVTGAGLLRERTGAKSVVAAVSGVECVSVPARHGDSFGFGKYIVEVRATPGHTDGCLSFIVRADGQTFAFTGDSLFVRGCGRTDFQQGSAQNLYHSIHQQLYTLPDDTIVYPGHDYRGHTMSTIGEEKALNPRIREGIEEEEFVATMTNLDLPNPKRIHIAVAANAECGMPADEMLIRAM